MNQLFVNPKKWQADRGRTNFKFLQASGEFSHFPRLHLPNQQNLIPRVGTGVLTETGSRRSPVLDSKSRTGSSEGIEHSRNLPGFFCYCFTLESSVPQPPSNSVAATGAKRQNGSLQEPKQSEKEHAPPVSEITVPGG